MAGGDATGGKGGRREGGRSWVWGVFDCGKEKEEDEVHQPMGCLVCVGDFFTWLIELSISHRGE